jgi:hypothetical protein
VFEKVLDGDLIDAGPIGLSLKRGTEDAIGAEDMVAKLEVSGINQPEHGRTVPVTVAVRLRPAVIRYHPLAAW